MELRHKLKQIMTGLTFGFLVVTGTYNAIVINSESGISSDNMRFAKSIDEVYGTALSRREVAAAMPWQKLSIKQASIFRVRNKRNKRLDKLKESSSVALSGSESFASEAPAQSQAAVQDDLSLNLTAVINPKKWKEGLNNSQFSGTLAANSGVIESLSVSLPNGEGISVSFSEMTGNVFEYDLGGDLFSGMMYQDNQNSYVVRLTNGPLEGTLLTFTGEPTFESQIQQEDSQRALAESSEGEAGVEQAEQAPQQEIAQQDQEIVQPEVQPENVDAQAQDIYAQEQGQLDQAPEQAQGFDPEQNQAAL